MTPAQAQYNAGDGRADVVVVGSVNRDYVCRVAHLPKPGETVLGGDVVVGSGGKGGNQAVAASLLGARTAMIARIGHDSDGHALIEDLVAAGVDTTHVIALDDARTGTAFVLVATDGENAIVVAPGANGRLTATDASSALQRLLAPPAVMVVQAEVPTSTMVGAIMAATELGCRAVVNLAPFQVLPAEVLALSDPLVVNESEASGLLGSDVHDIATARKGAAQLARRTRSVVITLGAAGAMVATGDDVDHVPTSREDVVDSTGAGDAFTGALATALSRGADVLAAAALGVQAGSYAVGRPGAQSSYPKAADIGRQH